MANKDSTSPTQQPGTRRCSNCWSARMVKCDNCLVWYCNPSCNPRHPHRRACVPPPVLLGPSPPSYLELDNSSDSDQICRLFLLPNEILVDNIVCFLSVAEVIILSKTCKKLEEKINGLYVLEKVVLPVSEENKGKFGGRYILDLELSVNTRYRRDGGSWDYLQEMNLTKMKKLKFNGPNFRLRAGHPRLHYSYIYFLSHFLDRGAHLVSLDILLDGSPQLLTLAEEANKLTMLEEITFRGSRACLGSSDTMSSPLIPQILDSFLSRSRIRKFTLKDLPTWKWTGLGRGLKLQISSPSLEVINISWPGDGERICKLDCDQLKEITLKEEGFSLCLYHCHASEDFQFPDFENDRMGGLGPLLYSSCPRLEMFNDLDLNRLRSFNAEGNWLIELSNHRGEGVEGGRRCYQCETILGIEGSSPEYDYEETVDSNVV